MLDDLEFEFDTHEYRINGGDWAIALTADYTGVDIDYPELIALTDDELGSLAPIITAITRETGTLRIPMKPATYSDTKPATHSDFIPATVPI